MVQCCVPYCKNRNDVNKTISYYRFPPDEKERDRWLKSIRRDNFTPNSNSRVCGWHFLKGKAAGPTRFAWNEGRAFLDAITSLPAKRSGKRMLPPPPGCAEQDAAAHALASNPAVDPASRHRGDPASRHHGNPASHHSSADHEAHNRPGNREEEVKAVKERLAEQERELLNLKTELHAKDRQITLLGKELNAYTPDTLTPESLNRSHVPGYFHHCTGFTYDQFNSLCEFFKVPSDPIAPQTHIPLTYKMADVEIRNTPLRSQLLLTLMKLRQNADHEDLAFRFNVCLPSVGTLMNSWVDYMYHRLGKLSVWAHREVISQNMPGDYKEDFPNTFAILDCAELEVERPGSLPPQSQTDSAYKSSNNTLKSLVACDPRGALMYVSALVTGSLSDTEMFHQCDLTELLRGCIRRGYLKVGDGLMSGFLIEKEVREIGLRLNIPPLDPLDSTTGSSRQMSHAHVDMTQNIARHRVHVERAVAKIKEFRIVSGRIPMSRLGNINQIWYVVSMLSNFQPHIAKDG